MPRFPRGIVTFLCATSSAPNDWVAHLRTAVTSQGGVIFAATEVSRYAVFNAALPALHVALQVLRDTLATGSTGLVPALALVTGPTHEHDGKYFGPTLNRALSILEAAHPGQILLSTSTYDVIQVELPEGVHLQSLGDYRLKDLLRTTQLYQVATPGLPAEFPLLRTLDVRPHNLPIQDSPLIGREQEVASTCALLRDPATRLLTLLSSSGMGKTRLALQVAVEVIDDFTDGVYFVALAPVSNPDLLVALIAQVLGVKEQAGQSLLNTLASFLQAKQMLLLLDNFEQLRAAAPTLLELLTTTTQLTVLVTSQVVLDLEPEHVFVVPPLAMPDPTKPIRVDELSQVPAVALFIERARDVQPSFMLSDLNAPAVIELCTRLEGVPLALELVAAQSQRYFPGDMLIMLQNRLSLARTIRQGNTREDTLRPVLDWICEVLGPDVAGLFARLGVFAGGCTSESATAICNPDNDLALDVDQALAVLLENHLLLREELKEGHVRYTMLDAIHDYAEHRLTRRREVSRIQSAHASYYTSLAETAEPLLKGAEQLVWLARLEDEHHNLRAALKWMLAHDPEHALRLSSAVVNFWYIHGHYSEGRQWLQATLDQAPAAPPAMRAKALHGLGTFSAVQTDYDAATRIYEVALALRRELGDTVGMGQTLNNLGIIASQRGDYQQAETIFEECLTVYRELDNRRGIAMALLNLGVVLSNQGYAARAAACYEECLVDLEALGDMGIRALVLANLGQVSRYQGDYARATAVLIQALELIKEQQNPRVQSVVFESQARLSLTEGDLATARRLLTECIRIRQRLGNKHHLVQALDVLAELVIAEGQPMIAPRVLGASATLRQVLGSSLVPIELNYITATTASALDHMSQATFDVAYQRGIAMPLDELLDQVLGTLLPDPTSI